MTRKLVIGGIVVALVAAGAWLWSRHGLAVFVDAAIAFCT
jgi:hypothetical protein